MGDRILDADEVAEVEVVIDGLSNDHPIAWEDWRRLDGLAVSHEALREQNTGLGVRVQEAWRRTEQAEEALAAMTAVARRYRHGWYPWADRNSQGWHLPRARGGQRIGTDEPMTDAERAALDALEANDGD